MNALPLAGCLLVCAATAGAAIDGIVSGSADSGFSFLKIQADAAPGAMGEAGVALEQGALGALVNPANRPADGRTVFAVSNNDWLVGSTLLSGAGAFAAGPAWITLHARVLELDGFELRSGPNPDPDGEFSLQDVCVGVNAALATGLPGLDAGLGVALVHEKIYEDDSRTLALSAGLRYTKGPWAAGLALGNLGSDGELAGEDVPLPRRITAGAGWTGRVPRLDLPTRVALDLVTTRDEDSHLHLGAELQPLDPLLLRAGWLGNYEDRSFSWGLGLRWKGFRLDYANLPFKKDFDDTQKFTFSFLM